MRHLLTLAASLVAVCMVTVSSASAQETMQAVDRPRCGGLLCDIGLFGGADADKTTLPCNDFMCRAFGGSQQAAVALPPPIVPEPALEKKPPSKQRKAVKIAKKPSSEGTSGDLAKK